jgi:cephalosporin hydroxylase
MNDINLNSYFQNGFRNVQGFCPDYTVHILDLLQNLNFNKDHGVMEIGIHHGQFFMALNSVVEPDYKSVAIDVFGRQDLNIDKSGQGIKEVFVNNLKRYDRHFGENVIIVEGDSTDSFVFEGVEIPDKYKYISVDGGHTVEHIISDMNLVSKLLTNEGLIVVDDYLNHWWPSVTEGLLKYMSTNPTLVPVMSTPNKMWMSKLSYKPKYDEAISKFPIGNRNEVSLFGHKFTNFW